MCRLIWLKETISKICKFNVGWKIVFQFSNDEYVKKYERDLVLSINSGERGMARIGIGENLNSDLDLDVIISLENKGNSLPEEYLAIASVLPAQMLGFFKSLNLGLKPDTPSKSGTITRVVEGVEIYPYTKSIVSKSPV